tara:strand:- start:42 stop:476 length:435 start_codon:yes stop_codon:yes gene_type:complete
MSIFYDTLYNNLRDLSNGDNIPRKHINIMLRDCDEILIKKNTIQLSILARKKHGKGSIEPNEPKPKGLYFEHVIPVRERVEELIKIFGFKTKDRKIIDEFISDTFYGFYKIKDLEPDEEYNSEKYIHESFRQHDKIVNFKDNIL